MVVIKQYSKATNKYEIFYKMKTSVNKISYPCPKQVFRFEENNCFIKDILALEEERIENANPLTASIYKRRSINTKIA